MTTVDILRTTLFILVVSSVLLFSALVTGCSQDPLLATYLQNNQEQLTQPLRADRAEVQFDVAPGTPARVIAQNLVDAELIGDARLFEAYVRLNGIADQLEAGTFTLSPSMTPVEIAEALQNARAQGIAVTIPEGWRLEQIADYLSEEQILDGEAYANAAQDVDQSGIDLSQYGFLGTRPTGSSLEGYLFPSTYQLPADHTNAPDLLRRQLDAFAAQVLPVYEEAFAGGATDLDLFTVLILASIVEREAVVPEERPAIASVYLNRLTNGIKLEADPTVQYAMGYQPDADQWWKTPVTLAEYSAVDSPYNTYLYPGLPPGPIANPGLASIRAVLYPDEHSYLYFVATPDGSGAHVFAETWEEHVENVARYQQGQ